MNISLRLNVGYCHPVDLQAPEGVEFKVDGEFVSISGPDKEQVGQIAAVVRSKRPPEPYKGKGVRYADEHVKRKEAKKAAGAGA